MGCVVVVPTCGPMPPMPRGGFILIGPPMFGCPVGKHTVQLVKMEALFWINSNSMNSEADVMLISRALSENTVILGDTLRSGGVQAVW